VTRAMLTADRDRGGINQLLRKLGTHLVAAIVAKLREALARETAKGSRGGVLLQDRSSERGVEVFEIAGELGKSQIRQPMKLIDPRDHLLHQLLLAPFQVMTADNASVGIRCSLTVLSVPRCMKNRHFLIRPLFPPFGVLDHGYNLSDDSACLFTQPTSQNNASIIGLVLQALPTRADQPRLSR
jgi:hypothetical protein